jgi:hypothetical protein
MGRKKIDEKEKKIKIGVSVDPELPNYFKEKSINLSSLVNKLLKEYIKKGNKILEPLNENKE